ncbi:MAG: helix-turn-helix transcriptional regulator [Candidatus Kapaibacterium sp.]
MKSLNSEDEKNILLRFKKLFRASGLSKSQFALKIGITHQSLNRYLKNIYDIQKITFRLFNIGYSIHWLYSGNGEPFLKNAEKNNLSELFENYDYKIQKQRIKTWIEDNYTNVMEYEISRDFRKNEIQSLFNSENEIPYLILKRIENSGCNLYWSITGKGSCFADNQMGKKLIKRFEE